MGTIRFTVPREIGSIAFLTSEAVAAYSPITPFIEFAPAEVYESPLRRELQSASFPVRDGVIDLPLAPGIGYDLLAKTIERFRI